MADTKAALQILIDLGFPEAQQREITRFTLLSLAGLDPSDEWDKASNRCIGVHDMIKFIAESHGKEYADGTREDVRRQVIHQFEQAHLVEKNPDDRNRPINSPNTCYALTSEALKVIQSYGTNDWKKNVEEFRNKHGDLETKYQTRRKESAITVSLPNEAVLRFSPGKHNELQAAVIKEFWEFFIPDAELLYVGDTARKMLYLHESVLSKLKIPITKHAKLPDLLFLWAHDGTEYLVIVEVVTSHGPVSPKRRIELEESFSDCVLPQVYVTAFDTFKSFNKYSDEIAWGTEVWIREMAEHIIHFNGPTIKGPTK